MTFDDFFEPESFSIPSIPDKEDDEDADDVEDDADDVDPGTLNSHDDLLCADIRCR